MDKKKKNNWFARIMLALFIMFLCLYSMSVNGYVENTNMKKALYTEEQIKQFENDVSNGEYIDMKAYADEKDSDYSNKVSDFGENLSDLISLAARKSIDMFNNVFAYLFE